MEIIKYHFFGKELEQSNLEESLQKLGINHSYGPLFVKQFHSNEVVTIDNKDNIYAKNDSPDADAMVTNVRGLVLAIVTADCIPIMFFDKKSKVIGAAHAGWRGTKSNIIARTIKEMVDLGAEKGSIIAIMGPCIRQESYEVSEEFYQDFLRESTLNEIFFIKSNKKGHYMFDLPSYAIKKLQNENIAQIIDEEPDTYSSPDQLFSYRRSCHLKTKDSNRNISVIVNMEGLDNLT